MASTEHSSEDELGESATDNVTAESADGATTEQTAAVEGAVYAWAPADSAPKKRKRRWPWIAIPAAGVVAGLVVASVTLIAPGVSAAGVSIGGLTPAAAETAITSSVADAELTINTDAGPITLSGADLGASIDARAAAQQAFDAAPAWNFGSWGSDHATATIVLDAEKATAALREALPDSYADPTDASVTFDATAGTYVVTPAADGTGIALAVVRAGLEQALTSKTGAAAIDADIEQIAPLVSTEAAELAVTKLNELTKNAGFFIDAERTVPVEPAQLAEWITPTINADGTLSVDADEAKIATFVETLPTKVNRPAVDGVWLVDRQGNQLPDTIYTKEGVEGRTMGDTSTIASAYAAQLEEGNNHFALTVTKVEPTITTLERWIEVDISDQTVYVWENGEVIRTMLTSSGLSPNDSSRGTFRINSHITLQDMGCVKGYDYCTKDVPWVMYYNGDEALHGTWWHSNFGTPMSHGCMNLSVDNAKWLWDWTPIGTEVWVHD